MAIQFDNSNTGVATLKPATSGTIALTLPSADGTSGQALTTDGLGQLAFATVGGGGVTGFTAAESTAAPNATVYVDALTAAAVSTNADVAFVAKGTGATLAQVPDSTTAGGNKRGTHATDWQKARTAAAQVASGNYSVILGGQNNTAGGLNSVVGGSGNTASGTQSIVIGGLSNNTSITSSAILSGQNNALTALARHGVAILTGSQNSNLNASDGFYGSAYGGAHNSAIVSGGQNKITGSAQVIGSGWNNRTDGQFATVLGGHYNNSRIGSTTLGGYLNTPGTTYANRNQTVTTATANSALVTLVSGTMPSVGSMWFSGGYGTNGDGYSGSWAYVIAIGAGTFTVSENIQFTRTSESTYWVPINALIGSGGHNLATGVSATVVNGGQAGVPASLNQATKDFAFIGNGTGNSASGLYSFVGNGSTNTASNEYAAVVSGQSNTASGGHSTVVGGQNNTVSSQWGATIGGSGNTSNSSNSSVVIGGNGCTASGNISVVMGGQNNTTNSANSIVSGGYGITRSIVGNAVFSSHDGAVAFSNGASQSGLLIIGRQTTDATPTVLRCNGSAPGTTNQVILPNNSAYYFRGSIAAGVTGGGNSAMWTFEGGIKRGANAAATTLIQSVINPVAADAGASSWIVALTADTTNGGLAVTVTGQTANTIRWVCKIETTEMTY